MDYPQVSTATAAEELNRLYGEIIEGTKETREMKRQYNSLVCKNNKLRDMEALLQFRYCAKLRTEGIVVNEQVVVKNGRVDAITETHIIEFKYGSSREKIYCAIGQLEYYSHFYPFHKQKIVVPNCPPLSMQNILKYLFIEWEEFPCLPM